MCSFLYGDISANTWPIFNWELPLFLERSEFYDYVKKNQQLKFLGDLLLCELRKNYNYPFKFSAIFLLRMADYMFYVQ